MPAALDAVDLDAINARFESAHPREVIAWAAKQWGEGLVMTSSFGEQAAVLLHLASGVVPGIKVIFIDTGYLFAETHAFMESLRKRLNLNVWTYRTRNDPFAYLKSAGEADPLTRNDVAACCAANKNEPMDRAMRELAPAAWLRGIRRGQAESRKAVKFVEWSDRYGCFSVSPILNWTSRDVGLYMKEHDLPYHPLVEKGYLSIGCNPETCTRPVKEGEDPRAGRWAGTGKLECGIHLPGSAQPK